MPVDLSLQRCWEVVQSYFRLVVYYNGLSFCCLLGEHDLSGYSNAESRRVDNPDQVDQIQ